ncbi:hypothetical protein EIL87_03815 [Saccharopolyspora rhizosphaerae]|uniref:Uncharacterized protein n=1 Tax=Saccharopolyspora rhizosphaerae TaxID=2492662 RepID=A0A3R8QTL4_9PSEU|nr:hypothetical protein [Saccharopolyspora rhizosphaerae]RRO19250.1 hypothetical protein EIL87_03815 [Saccharopolyspora rhizosphaerae]
MRSWLTWGIPLAVVVLLAAGTGGVLLARFLHFGGDEQRVQGGPSVPGVRADQQPVVSRSGVEYSPDAAAYPDQRIIEGLLDNYFDGINRKNYELWKSTVPPSKWRELPQSKWFDDYDSTRDHDMKVHRIDPGQDRSALVMLSFKSEQDLEDAPPQVKAHCVQWDVVYPVVVDENGNAVLDISKLPNSAIAAPCA